MFGSAFGLPRFYESPNYYDYPGAGGGYGRRAQNFYPTGRGYDVPYAEMSPNMRHMYGMPVEIPVMHEGSGDDSVKQSMTDSRKPRMPDQRRSPNREVQESRQPSQKSQNEQKSSSYPVRQVSMNEMDASDDDDDEESFPFYSGMPLNIFGGGFPRAQQTSRSRAPTAKVSQNRASPQRDSGKTRPKFKNISPKRQSPQQKTSSSKSPTAKPTQNYKSRTIPIVREQVNDDSCNAVERESERTEHIPDPMEQLESIKNEMDDIKSRVENFSGEKKDKEYIFLDEMMTSLLLKLDMIESGGVEEIRNRRRQLVRLVQEYVQKLEQKVGILPTDEGTLAVGNVETTEVDNADKSKDEECADVVSLDIPNEEELAADSLTTVAETSISSPELMEIEKTVRPTTEDEETLSVGNMETTEVDNADKSKDEECGDVVSLDIQNEEEQAADSLTTLAETSISSPELMEIEKTVRPTTEAEETLSVGNMETTEVDNADKSKDEECGDVVSLDIQNKEEQAADSLTTVAETSISSPELMEIEKTVRPTTENDSTSAEELSDCVKHKSLSEEESMEK